MAMKNSNNSSDRAYDRDAVLLELAGGCACAESSELSQADYDRSIAEIEAMIAYSIDTKNEEEIRSWRSMLQRTKVEKRRAKMSNLRRRMYA